MSKNTKSITLYSTNIKLEDPDVEDILLGIHSDDLIDFIQKNYSLEEVFPEDQLNEWATSHGFVNIIP